MKIYHYSLQELGVKTIDLGKRGENKVREIEFDLRDWIAEYPGASVALYISQPNTTVYLATTNMVDGVLKWPIIDTYTAIPGFGDAEIVLSGTDGERLKSVTASIFVSDSLSDGAPGEAPDYMKPYVDQVAENAAKVEEALEEIKDISLQSGNMPTGGSTGQLLAKKSAENYDTHWIDPPSGSGTGGGVADSVAWDNVTDKPSTYPPAAHTHPEYLGKNEAAANATQLKDQKADVIRDTSARAASHTLHAQRGPLGVTLYGKTTETGTGDKSPDNPYEIVGENEVRMSLQESDVNEIDERVINPTKPLYGDGRVDDTIVISEKVEFDKSAVIDGSVGSYHSTNRWYMVSGYDLGATLAEYPPYSSELPSCGIGAPSTPGISVASGATHILIRLSDVERTTAAYKEYLAAHPITVFFRSADYAPEKMLTGCVETHKWDVVELTGNETYGDSTSSSPYIYINGVANMGSNSLTELGGWCTDFPVTNIVSTNYAEGIGGYGSQLIVRWSGYDAQALKSLAAARYAAGNPIKIGYKRSSDLVYIHPAIELKSNGVGLVHLNVTADCTVEYAHQTKDYIDRSIADAARKYAQYNLPVLALTGDTAGMSKDDAVDLSYEYKGLTGIASVKWQGSSSLSYPKKNYTIKFDEAFEAKDGWGAQKKYCLKANWIDASHARNVVSAIKWGQIVKSRTGVDETIAALPNGGAVDGFPCVITINGEFQGLFTWNIPKDGWMYGMGDGSQEAILCADDHVSATQFKAAATLDGDFELEYVSDENNADWVLTSLNRMINAVISSDGTDLDTTIAQYLDWQSAIDYYIFTVLVKGSDMTDKNYLLYTYDGVKWHFGAYDMDSTWGLHWNGGSLLPANTGVTFSNYAERHRVMSLIKNYKTSALKARYEELREAAMSEDSIATDFGNFIGAIPSGICDMERKRWPAIPNTSVNDLHQITNWYRRRVAVIDAEIDAL